MNESRFHEFLLGLSSSPTGARRARRIEGCTFQQVEDGYTSAFSCKDSVCPRCRRMHAQRAAERLSELRGLQRFDSTVEVDSRESIDGDSSSAKVRMETSVRSGVGVEEGRYARAFCTFTQRESASVASFQAEVATRRRFIVSCARIAGLHTGLVVTEFTINVERIHLHYHTVWYGERSAFDRMHDLYESKGERHVDVAFWDGRPAELVKYLSPVLNYEVGLLLSGTRGMRVRTWYGLSKKPKGEQW